ncbi:MAG: hypothetical protein WCJ09_28295 [Planctomycetota bacterium]
MDPLTRPLFQSAPFPDRKVEHRMVSSSFLASIAVVTNMFSESDALNSIGFAKSERQLMDQTIYRPAFYRFTLRPSAHRNVLIDFSDDITGKCYFIVGIINTEASDSFLLEEWLRLRGLVFEVSPCLLFTQAGTEQERLVRFVAFLEQEFSTKEMRDILSGKSWVHIPFDWDY